MKDFHSKILLLGEYSIVKGSQAYTIPYRKYSGSLTFLSFPDPKNPSKLRSAEVLRKLAGYLKKENLFLEAGIDLFALEKDIERGLFFYSTIPFNYGLGSSGALVAALYSSYCYEHGTDLLVLMKKMAIVESFFHGKSSGIDPLVIYLGEPVLFNGEEIIICKQNNLHASFHEFYICDTGIQAKTLGLMQIFEEKLQDVALNTLFSEYYVPLVNSTVQSLFHNNRGYLAQGMEEISRFQYSYLTDMVPRHMLGLWEIGLHSGEYFFKLCGSGGGGYLLVYTKIPLAKIKALSETKFPVLSVVSSEQN